MLATTLSLPSTPALGASVVAQSIKNLPAVQETARSAGDWSSIPGSGRSLGGGHGNALQYSCLENYMDRRALWATVHGVAESDMTEQLSPMSALA